MSADTPVRFLTKKEVYGMLAVSRATFERMVSIGLFAKPIQVGKRAVRWNSAEVAECISNMPRVEDAYASHLGDSEKGGAA